MPNAQPLKPAGPAAQKTAENAPKPHSILSQLGARGQAEQVVGADLAPPVEDAVEALLRLVAGKHVTEEGVTDLIEGIVARLDERLTAQTNEILHHPDFQRLEGTWRGLDFLLRNTVTSKDLKIKVLNVGRQELVDMCKEHRGNAFDESPLFKRVYEEGLGTANADPFACLVGDFEFDYRPESLLVLDTMAKIAASAHAPFIAGASPRLLGIPSWTKVNEIDNPETVTATPLYGAWNAFRKREDARYVGLAMPRFLSRLPYGEETDKVTEFAFEEDTAGGDPAKYTWSNSAYAMAANITRAFAYDGFCTRIRGHESGGRVDGLPFHTYQTGTGEISHTCPTEVNIPDRREHSLSKCGLMPLVNWKNTNHATFIGGQSVQAPTHYIGPDGDYATANANLSARLTYLFATCRFAHYLKCIVRDKVGSFGTQESLHNHLQTWINEYVIDTETRTEEDMARKPLLGAKVLVEVDPRDAGYFTATFLLRPHVQIEGVDVTLSLVSQLERAKAT